MIMKKTFTLLTLALTTALTASAQWNTDNTPLKLSGSRTSMSMPMAVRTADGKTFVSFNEWSPQGFKYYMQALDAEGNLKFGDDGITIDGHLSPSWCSDYGLVATNDGCAVLSCADSRVEEANGESEGTQFVPAFYKIDIDQNFLWGLDGVSIDSLDMCNTAVFNFGGDIWARCDDDTTYMFRLTDDGAVAQEKPIGISAASVVGSTGTDFITVYGTTEGARAMRYNRDGQPVWSAPAELSTYRFEGYGSNPYQVASDGKGGAYVSFTRNYGVWDHIVTAQRVTADGDPLFGLNSLDTYATEELDHDYAAITGNDASGLVVWAMNADNGVYNLQAQKFTSDGERAFGDTGLTLASHENAAGYAFHPLGLATLKGGDWIICYAEELGWSKNNAYVMRLTPDGKQLWKRQIGSTDAFNNATFIVEEEASYLIWQSSITDAEWNTTEAILAERIFNDGSFGVNDGISDIEAAPANGSTTYYSLDGRQLDAPQAGLTIVRHADGQTCKVLR